MAWDKQIVKMNHSRWCLPKIKNDEKFLRKAYLDYKLIPTKYSPNTRIATRKNQSCLTKAKFDETVRKIKLSPKLKTARRVKPVPRRPLQDNDHVIMLEFAPDPSLLYADKRLSLNFIPFHQKIGGFV